jgi:hypothetical protein
MEDGKLERKGSRMLDLTLPGVSESDVKNELAKQLSAFANMGGGRILYGVTDDGQIDKGGISSVIKGGRSPKDWLESVIPTLTDYEITGINVYCIPARSPNSAIQQGKSIYVVDVPDSERAPHQSNRDHRYYVRMGGSSRPAPHKLIEDIRNRAIHPNLNVVHSEVLRVHVQKVPNTLKAQVELGVRLTLKNVGRVKANNACIFVEHGMLRVQPFDLPLVLKNRVEPSGVFWELLFPVYPDMEFAHDLTCQLRVEKRLVPPGGSITVLCYEGTDKELDDATVRWRIFADSAPPKSGSSQLVSPALIARIQDSMIVRGAS